MIRVDVTSSRELLAMVRLLKFIERDWLSLWTRESRAKLEPEWREELEASRPTRLQRAVLVRTSRVSVSRKSILLKAGSVGKLAPTGTKASKLARAAEFGQDQNLRTKYFRKDKPVPAPARHTVKRRTAVPVGPRNPRGNVVWPALERFVPRAAALAAETFYDILRRISGVS
ncbi:hypothetical protein J2X03_003784 [Microbacterium trichothecenolyticum]|uniref:hypothetical protein n=1 Tax=Microbacterium trichothecenolyticum TaxID=69370 RepID=UPI00285859E8|nr:hypothetical protein [Microbacterium trichothecenolyticum]MDR7113882.1 hypothetical protein [Microbacterium trichothecenolyticum]